MSTIENYKWLHTLYKYLVFSAKHNSYQIQKMTSFTIEQSKSKMIKQIINKSKMNIKKTNKIHFISNQKYNIFNKRSIHLKKIKKKNQSKTKYLSDTNNSDRRRVWCHQTHFFQIIIGANVSVSCASASSINHKTTSQRVNITSRKSD